MQDREEFLKQRILEKQNDFEKEQGKRVKITFFILSGVIFLMALMYGGISDGENFLYLLICTPIIAGFVMFISYLILSYIMSGAIRKVETIARLEGELYAIKFNKYE